MINWPRSPLVLEVNAFTWLKELSRQYDRDITLGSIPEEAVTSLVSRGFDALWLMGVWQRSPRARDIAASLDFLQAEYRQALPGGYTEDDVTGSPYAVLEYRVDERLGGTPQLEQFHARLRNAGLKLILDFVPNHLALDHAWIKESPERFVQGTARDLEMNPGNFFTVSRENETLIFACGRALDSSVWTDTVQLDFRRKETRGAMLEVLESIASLCDGIRCDMAMLVLKEVFCKTWPGFYEGDSQFWAEAVCRIKAGHPGFLFMGEVYWGYEYRMQQLGFDFVYDKVLYDRVLGKHPPAVYDHLYGGNQAFQSRLVRFIENHDEARVVEKVGIKHSLAAATLVLTLPGLHFIHEGQEEGLRSRLPVQLGRRAEEAPLRTVQQFYSRLLAALKEPLLRKGHWVLLTPRQASPDNQSCRNIIACLHTLSGKLAVVMVNLASTASQCFLPIPVKILPQYTWQLEDLLSDLQYRRDGARLVEKGLFLDLPGFGHHIFKFHPVSSVSSK